MDQLLIECAKQVPALGVLCAVVYLFLQDKSRESQKSEERLKAVIDTQSVANKLLQETLAANNVALGGVTTFMSILQREATTDVKRPRT